MHAIDFFWNRFMLFRKKVKYEDGLQLYGRVHIHGKKGGISIGKDCKICSSVDYNPTAEGDYTHLVVGPEGKLVIGSNVGMSMAYISAYESVIIEDNVLLGACVKIWDTDFHPLIYEDRIAKKEAMTKPVLIKEGAFIGACSIVLKGVTVGAHSVIGAGSVVTRDIPDGEIWAGNPAKMIRKIEEL